MPPVIYVVVIGSTSSPIAACSLLASAIALAGQCGAQFRAQWQVGRATRARTVCDDTYCCIVLRAIYSASAAAARRVHGRTRVRAGPQPRTRYLYPRRRRVPSRPARRRRRAADARRRRLPTVPWQQPTATRLRRTLRHGTVLGRYPYRDTCTVRKCSDCCTAAGASLLVGRLAYHHERFSGASASTTARSLGTSREPTRSWSGCWMRSGVSRSAGDACDAHTRAVRIARTYHGPNYTP